MAPHGTIDDGGRRGYSWDVTAATQALLEQALRLTAEERAELADALRRADRLDDADPSLSDEELARVWRPELDRRRAEIERGEVQTVDARTAIDEMRARLRSGAR